MSSVIVNTNSAVFINGNTAFINIIGDTIKKGIIPTLYNVRITDLFFHKLPDEIKEIFNTIYFIGVRFINCNLNKSKLNFKLAKSVEFINCNLTNTDILSYIENENFVVEGCTLNYTKYLERVLKRIDSPNLKLEDAINTVDKSIIKSISNKVFYIINIEETIKKIGWNHPEKGKHVR